jgi:hypothetical protein
MFNASDIRTAKGYVEELNRTYEGYINEIYLNENIFSKSKIKITKC